MDLFETVTICKFREGNFGANNFSHGNFIIRDKKYNKCCFSHGFLWNRHYIYIYILWLLVTPLINRDCMGTYSHKFLIDRDQMRKGWTYGHGIDTIVTKVYYLF